MPCFERPFSTVIWVILTGYLLSTRMIIWKSDVSRTENSRQFSFGLTTKHFRRDGLSIRIVPL